MLNMCNSVICGIGKAPYCPTTKSVFSTEIYSWVYSIVVAAADSWRLLLKQHCPPCKENEIERRCATVNLRQTFFQMRLSRFERNPKIMSLSADGRSFICGRGPLKQDCPPCREIGIKRRFVTVNLWQTFIEIILPQFEINPKIMRLCADGRSSICSRGCATATVQQTFFEMITASI